MGATWYSWLILGVGVTASTTLVVALLLRRRAKGAAGRHRREDFSDGPVKVTPHGVMALPAGPRHGSDVTAVPQPEPSDVNAAEEASTVAFELPVDSIKVEPPVSESTERSGDEALWFELRSIFDGPDPSRIFPFRDPNPDNPSEVLTAEDMLHCLIDSGAFGSRDWLRETWNCPLSKRVALSRVDARFLPGDSIGSLLERVPGASELLTDDAHALL